MSVVKRSLSWVGAYNAWCHHVASTPTGGLVFAAAFGLGVALDNPLLLGPLLEGLFPFAGLVGDGLGMLAIMFGGVTAYGLLRRQPFLSSDS